MMDKNHKTYFLVPLGLVIAIIILALNTKAPDVNISSVPGELRNTISVSGTGLVTVEPDEAEIYVNIITEADTAEKAQQDNADKAESVRNALIRQGVKDDDMETSSYYMYPKTNYNRITGESEIYGYSLTHVLKITTKDVGSTGELVDAAVEAGANGLQNINFQLSDELRDKTYDEALKEGSAMAKQKAQSISSSLGVTLGNIVTISESGVSYSPYRYYAPMAEMSMDEKAGGAPTVISPQDVEVSAYVSVVYEIE
ncbi:SIMPL domain-containing protein [Candidatus Woesearchaeota archaeon]|nr:SIMPL domain-containing protein [Candidatus Woesearchaeota archaeon]